MKYLGSSDKSIEVILRGDLENILMPEENGKALMDYLTSGDVGSHVMITDLNGEKLVVNKNDIRIIKENKNINYEIDWNTVR